MDLLKSKTQKYISEIEFPKTDFLRKNICNLIFQEPGHRLMKIQLKNNSSKPTNSKRFSSIFNFLLPTPIDFWSRRHLRATSPTLSFFFSVPILFHFRLESVDEATGDIYANRQRDCCVSGAPAVNNEPLI